MSLISLRITLLCVGSAILISNDLYELVEAISEFDLSSLSMYPLALAIAKYKSTFKSKVIGLTLMTKKLSISTLDIISCLLGGLIMLAIIYVSIESSEASKLEADYQAGWCKGQAEVTLKDRTRVDCLTDTHAIEIDFANKWKQAIGQSLHYALMTNKKPGIALILRKPSDKRYLDQLKAVIERYQLSIEVWMVN